MQKCLQIEKHRKLNQKGSEFSCVIPSQENDYNIPKGLMFSFPIRSKGKGDFEMIHDIKLTAFAQEKINESTNELLKEM